jgi:pyruvate formate lyase activating enzyme
MPASFMKEAEFYKVLKKKEKIIQCFLCPHFCTLKTEEIGKCGVRKNIDGKLFSLVYGKPISIAVDPIEKKPLYHFLPGEKTLSIATVGCNLSCEHCQNFEISQGVKKSKKVTGENVSAKEIVKMAKQENSKAISYTYTEPTIFTEYILDIAKIAKKEKIKNITVTNGFINPLPLKRICNLLDASNIDLKSIKEDFYENICGARLNPVLEAIKIMHKNGVWIELTNLLIPGLNDSENEIKKLVLWVKKNVGVNVPLHFSAFYPDYHLMNLPPENAEIVKKARKIALKEGLNFVYTGNIEDEEGNNTYCPKCKKLLIKRKGFYVIENKLNKGKCFNCKEKIPGVWK